MSRKRRSTPQELIAEEAFGPAFEERLNELGLKGFLHEVDPPRTSRADFHDDEQATAWRRAMEQLADKEARPLRVFTAS
jgi:hypothetical protein